MAFGAIWWLKYKRQEVGARPQPLRHAKLQRLQGNKMDFSVTTFRNISSQEIVLDIFRTVEYFCSVHHRLPRETPCQNLYEYLEYK